MRAKDVFSIFLHRYIPTYGLGVCVYSYENGNEINLSTSTI